MWRAGATRMSLPTQYWVRVYCSFWVGLGRDELGGLGRERSTLVKRELSSGSVMTWRWVSGCVWFRSSRGNVPGPLRWASR